MIIENILNWWNTKYLDVNEIADHAEILFILVLISFSIITTKIWIDERNSLKVAKK